MPYVFGKSITRRLFPEVDGAPVNLPTQTPAIYVFEERPTLTAAKAGTGAISTITTWLENNESPYPRTYTIPAIDDPDSTSEESSEDYWIAINFRNESGEQIQTIIESFLLERIEANEDEPGAKVQDVIDVYPDIESYCDYDQIKTKLNTALQEVKLYVKSKGLKWTRLSELKDLKIALAYKVIQLVAESQFVDSEDKFDIRRQLYKEKYEDQMKQISLAYDKDGDGQADSKAQAETAAVITFR